jgi:hypothetical protein
MIFLPSRRLLRHYVPRNDTNPPEIASPPTIRSFGRASHHSSQ